MKWWGFIRLNLRNGGMTVINAGFYSIFRMNTHTGMKGKIIGIGKHRAQIAHGWHMAARLTIPEPRYLATI